MTKDTTNNLNIRELLNEFGAKDENDLQKKLSDDIELVKCIHCRKTISLLSCSWLDGDPICRDGCYG